MSDCIFCKIISGKVPCAKVYEDQKVIAFLDIAPVNKGHVLVVPKIHTENLLDTPEPTLHALFSAIKKLAPAVQHGAEADGLNINSNNGSAAGQLVMHYHWHIIPRYSSDGLKHWPHHHYEDDMTAWQKKITDNIR